MNATIVYRTSSFAPTLFHRNCGEIAIRRGRHTRNHIKPHANSFHRAHDNLYALLQYCISCGLPLFVTLCVRNSFNARHSFHSINLSNLFRFILVPQFPLSLSPSLRFRVSVALPLDAVSSSARAHAHFLHRLFRSPSLRAPRAFMGNGRSARHSGLDQLMWPLITGRSAAAARCARAHVQQKSSASARLSIPIT